MTHQPQDGFPEVSPAPAATMDQSPDGRTFTIRFDQDSVRRTVIATVAILVTYSILKWLWDSASHFIFLFMLAWLLSIVIRFALSRRREFLADAGSVELTKNPDAMISALRKIEGRGELVRANSAVMEMCVDNPREGFADIFATHPSVEKRVEALVQYAGGHDPGPMDIEPSEENQDEPQGSDGTEQTNPPSVPQEGNRNPGSFLPGKPPIELGAPAPAGSGGTSTATVPSAATMNGPRVTSACADSCESGTSMVMYTSAPGVKQQIVNVNDCPGSMNPAPSSNPVWSSNAVGPTAIAKASKLGPGA